MATLRQKRVARAVIENLTVDKPKTAGEVLKSVGYGTGLQNQPNRVLQSEGVQEELKILGFDPQEAKKVVAEILIGGENDTVKLKAADMIFKVHSTYAPEKSVRINLNKTEDSKLDALIAQIEDGLDNPEGTA